MKYRVNGPSRAYDTAPGKTVALDPDDPLVQLNVDNGVLSPAKTGKATKLVMPCPACTEQDTKPTPEFSSAEELEAHYGESHTALAAPAFTPDEEE